MEVSVVVSLSALFVGGLVWIVRLEGRVNGHDQRHETHEERYAEIRADLSYIRERLDKTLNGRGVG